MPSALVFGEQLVVRSSLDNTLYARLNVDPTMIATKEETAEDPTLEVEDEDEDMEDGDAEGVVNGM